MLSPPLLRLPVELHQSIIDKLELQDRVRLTLTCRYFLSIIKSPTHDEILAAEISPWAVNNELYACKGCTRLRHLRRFTDDMRKGKRTRRGMEANTRFCIDCGVERAWYQDGTEVIIMGQVHVLCSHCKSVSSASSLQTASKERCSRCLRAIQQMSAQSCTKQYDSDDDWDDSLKSFTRGKHSSEFRRTYPDF